MGDDVVLGHVAFYVEPEEELEGWHKKVDAADVQVVRPEGWDVIFFPDPNNATVQIIVGDPIRRPG